MAASDKTSDKNFILIYPEMPKGITPTRARRRQSDAKWRASVAMCYEIMKNVIPKQKLGRKKLSKALTLKETERHIICLERKIKELLQEKAPMMGKIVMSQSENGCLYPTTFDDIRKDFAVKQLSFFASNSSGSGKKRYNVPADIEASFDNLSQQSCSLVVMSRSDVKQGTVAQPPKLYKAVREPVQPDSITLGAQVMPKSAMYVRSSENEYSEKSESLSSMRTPFKIKRRTIAVSLPHTRRRSDGTTPKKTPKHRSTSTSTESPWCKDSCSFTTPSKVRKQLPFGQSPSGFTPVKLPLGLELVDQILPQLPLTPVTPATPAQSLFGSPFSCFSTLPETPSSCFNGVEYLDATDDDVTTGLLCTESIDNMYLEDSTAPPDTSTPYKSPAGSRDDNSLDLEEESFYSAIKTEPGLKPRPEYKCRRRLDNMYEVEPTRETEKAKDKSCLEFDGYLMFYNHHVGDLDMGTSGGGESPTIARMWESLNAEERATYARLATHGSTHHSTDLSDDLMAIDLKPFTKNSSVNSLVLEKRHYGDVSQEVPDLDLSCDLLSSPGKSHFHLVPEYEDLGIIYDDDFQKEARIIPVKAIKKELPDDSQVVPDYGMV